MAEPTWSLLGGGVFARPLLGSEAVADGLSVLSEGSGEVCMGVSFTSVLSGECLITRTRDALQRLRFQSPLVAARIEHDRDGEPRRWVYTVAKNGDDVQGWSQHALKVHPEAQTTESFISTINQTRLPYVDEEYELFFACHLLLRPCGSQSLFFHGTHAIMDAFPTLDALAQMLEWMSTPQESYLYPLSRLDWGMESANLPEGAVTATGGLRPGHEVEVPRLLKRMEEIANRPTATQAIHAQRDKILVQGKPVRVIKCLSVEQSEAVYRGVKALGFSITVLCEAAQILATFSRNDISPKDEQEAHVTLDISIISMKKRFVPPHNSRSHFVSALTYVPLVVQYKNIAGLGLKDQLIGVMAMLKRQYSEWTATPHLPSLGSHLLPAVFPNPYAGFITNLGVVEQAMPTTWPDAADPRIIVNDFAFGHRVSNNPRPLTHVWTFASKLFVQVQGADVWDESYLSSYVDDILQNVLLFSEC